MIFAFVDADIVYLNSSAEKAVSINILDSDDDFTTIEFVLNHYISENIEIVGGEYLNLFIPSGGTRLEVGYPELPLVARSLVIPPQSKMKIEILQTKYSEFKGQVAPSKGNLPRNINPADVPFSFSEIYEKDDFFPADIIELSDPYIMREIRGITFRVTPFAYNPQSGIIRNYERIVFKIYSEGSDTINTMSSRSLRITHDFEPIYENHFINYQRNNTRYTSITEEGSILVITHPNFVTAIQP